MESEERHGRGQGEGDDNRADEFSRDDRRSPGPEPGHEKGNRKGLILHTCIGCGGAFKNLGAHKRFCKTKPNIIIDNYMGKSLSSIVEDIENVLKSMPYTMDTNVSKGNGVFKSIELIIRIPVRR
jgi:hypothetical protein